MLNSRFSWLKGSKNLKVSRIRDSRYNNFYFKVVRIFPRFIIFCSKAVRKFCTSVYGKNKSLNIWLSLDCHLYIEHTLLHFYIIKKFRQAWPLLNFLVSCSNSSWHQEVSLTWHAFNWDMIAKSEMKVNCSFVYIPKHVNSRQRYDYIFGVLSENLTQILPIALLQVNFEWLSLN